MMAVKPNAGIAGGLAELGLTGTGEVPAEGDAFMAIMANLGSAPEGEGVDPAQPGAQELAKQMIAAACGGVTKCKSPESPGESVDPEANQLPAEEMTPEATSPGAPLGLAATTTDTVPVIGEGHPIPTRPPMTPAPAPANGKATAAVEGVPAATTVAVSAEMKPTQLQPAAVIAATPTVFIDPATETLVPAIADGAIKMSVSTQGKAAGPDPAAEADSMTPAAATALPSLLQLGTPALSRSLAALPKASPGKGEPPLASANADAKPAAATNFLVSSILPLLPESLHSIVLGQSAPLDTTAAGSSVAQPLDAAQAMIEQQLNLAHEGEWLDQLAKDIARSAGNEGGLRFRLNPENLGSLHVEMTQGAAGASIRMTTDTEAARAIIADAQPRLLAEARANGLKIAESHVDLGSSGQQASGDPRRQADLEQQQRFVRTAAAAEAEAPEIARPAVKAAERYA